MMDYEKENESLKLKKTTSEMKNAVILVSLKMDQNII